MSELTGALLASAQLGRLGSFSKTDEPSSAPSSRTLLLEGGLPGDGQVSPSASPYESRALRCFYRSFYCPWAVPTSVTSPVHSFI